MSTLNDVEERAAQTYMNGVKSIDDELLEHWNDYDLILTSSYQSAVNINKKIAASKMCGAFGVKAQSMDEWVSELWEQSFDGRIFIDDLLRLLYAQRSIAECEQNFQALQYSPGLAQNLAKCFRDGAGLIDFRAQASNAIEACPAADLCENAAAGGTGGTADNDKTLTPAEQDILMVGAKYFDCLQESNLIEKGQVLQYIARHPSEFFLENMRQLRVALFLDSPLNTQYSHFFQKLEDANILQTKTYLDSAEQFLQKKEDIKLRFSFPSGRYAQAKLLLEIIREYTSNTPSENSDKNPMGGTSNPAGCSPNPNSDLNPSSGSIVISSAHPMRLYRQLVGPLTYEHISESGKVLSCSVCATKPFSETQLGKTFIALFRVHAIDGFPWDKDALSDVLHSPFLALPKQRVYKYDAAIRSNRVLSRDEALSLLKNMKAFNVLENVLFMHDEPSFKAALARVQVLRASKALTQEQAAESLAVLNLMRAACMGAEFAQITDAPTLMEIYQNMGVSINFASTELAYGAHADVRIMTRAEAAKLPAHSCNTLILCDETSMDYPLSKHENALELFLKKFGIAAPENIANTERRKFRRLLNAATDTVIIERQLINDAAEPTYFSAMAQEFINAYRSSEGLQTGDDVDNVFQIPTDLQADMFSCGEYDVDDERPATDPSKGAQTGVVFAMKNERENIAALNKQADLMRMIYAGVDVADFAPIVTRDAFYSYLPQNSQLMPNILFSNKQDLPVGKNAKDVKNVRDVLPRLSPSSIEAYMQCPFKWFVERRLNITALDEDFGNATLGTFMHAVFEHFYSRFKEQTGQNKVREATLEQAKQIMSDVFEEVYQKQASVKNCGRRHVAQPGTSEELELAFVKEQLLEWLEFEISFLPEFEHALSEFSLDPQEAVFVGACWKGIIDRVDVRESDKSIAVIDYKGSLNTGYLSTKTIKLNKAKKISKLSGSSNKLYTENKGSKVQAALYLLILRELIKNKASSIKDIAAFSNAQVDSLCAALYVSYKRGHDVAGLFDADALLGEFADIKYRNRMAFSGGKSQIKDLVSMSESEDLDCEELDLGEQSNGLGPQGFGFGGSGSQGASPQGAGQQETDPLWEEEQPTFNTVLDGVQIQVQQAVKKLRAGNIYADPIEKKVCEFCSMQSCPMRRD